MNTPGKRNLIRRYIDAYNRFDVEGMMALIHPDIEFINVAGGEVNATASGANEFRSLAEQSKTLFSSREQTIITFEPTPDGASIEVAFTAGDNKPVIWAAILAEV